MKNFILVITCLLSVAFLLLNFSFAQAEEFVPPADLEETKELGKSVLQVLPMAFGGVWEEAKGIFYGFWAQFEAFWRESISPRLGNWLKEEIDKRKPDLQEEFKKEAEELKKEAPSVGKSLWERFKELLE